MSNPCQILGKSRQIPIKFLLNSCQISSKTCRMPHKLPLNADKLPSNRVKSPLKCRQITIKAPSSSRQIAVDSLSNLCLLGVKFSHYIVDCSDRSTFYLGRLRHFRRRLQSRTDVIAVDRSRYGHLLRELTTDISGRHCRPFLLVLTSLS